VSDNGWTEALATYAERLHAAAGPDHHVVSALSAWLLVALCAPLAENADRSEIAEALGADPMEAARFAAGLLTEPHPLGGSRGRDVDGTCGHDPGHGAMAGRAATGSDDR
jgi:hypothetical protein